MDHNCPNRNFSVRWILLFITCRESKREGEGDSSWLTSPAKGVLQGVTPGPGSRLLLVLQIPALESRSWMRLGRRWPDPALTGRVHAFIWQQEKAPRLPEPFLLRSRGQNMAREKRAGTHGAHETCLCAFQIGGDVNFYPVRESDS